MLYDLMVIWGSVAGNFGSCSMFIEGNEFEKAYRRHEFISFVFVRIFPSQDGNAELQHLVAPTVASSVVPSCLPQPAAFFLVIRLNLIGTPQS